MKSKAEGFSALSIRRAHQNPQCINTHQIIHSARPQSAAVLHKPIQIIHITNSAPCPQIYPRVTVKPDTHSIKRSFEPLAQAKRSNRYIQLGKHKGKGGKSTL